MCNKDNLLIEIYDFECISDVVNNCTIDRLCSHITEAQDIHLSNKVGWSLLQKVIDNPTSDDYKDLMNGSTFEYCGQTQKNFGLKRVLVHYSYGIYKYLNNYVDTSYGTVYKNVADSVPVDSKILKTIRDEHFNLANEYWKGVEMYLCANKEIFKEFNCKNECEGCKDGNDKSVSVGSRIRKARTFKKYGNK